MESMCLKGYRGYMAVCERYGMESVSFYQFVGRLTEEQIEEYSKLEI